jgi:hypothetical protein
MNSGRQHHGARHLRLRVLLPLADQAHRSFHLHGNGPYHPSLPLTTDLGFYSTPETIFRRNSYTQTPGPSVLWSYKPRETDEFTLDRGEILQILRISDDGCADGYRLGERAEEWTCGTAQEPTLPAWHAPSLNVKTFPPVCVAVPWAWKKCVKKDLKPRNERAVNSTRLVPTIKVEGLDSRYTTRRKI